MNERYTKMHEESSEVGRAGVACSAAGAPAGAGNVTRGATRRRSRGGVVASFDRLG